MAKRKLYQYGGREISCAELAAIAGLPTSTMGRRLGLGWPIEKALTKPLAHRHTTPTTDLTGQRFGRLIVITQAENKYYKRAVHRAWLCRCDCGNTKTITTPLLTTGKTRSCGCYARESASAIGHIYHRVKTPRAICLREDCENLSPSPRGKYCSRECWRIDQATRKTSRKSKPLDDSPAPAPWSTLELSQVVRLCWIDAQIRRGEYPTADSVAEKFGISRRTAFMDRNILKRTLKAPLYFNRAEGGWAYSNTRYRLPFVAELRRAAAEP